MDFCIPPKNYAQAESMEAALAYQRSLIRPEDHVGFKSAQAVADYLNQLGLRKRPITVATVKLWIRERGLPATRFPGAPFFTTNLHLFAWLWRQRIYKPRKR